MQQTLFQTPDMVAIFSAEAHVAALLVFEAALARAEARAGVIPAAAADAIAAACRVELFDVAALYRDAVAAGTLAIPLVKALTERVGGEHGRYVHWGATSQDAIDSALMLQMGRGLDLLLDGLLAIGEATAALAEAHRRTPMVGRTLLQQALPITFGLKAARWLALVSRQLRRLARVQAEGLVVQFGGAVGTLAALGESGLAVTELLAEELGLGVPDLPWHTERDRIAEVVTALGVVAGAMAKIAGDVVLLAQTEVGELAEAMAPGKGGSSAMPHKRNPVDATFAIASARLAIGAIPALLGALEQAHERDTGGWQLEWSLLPDVFGQTAGAVERVRHVVGGLTVDAERMRANLDLTGGLMMAESLTMVLAATIGRPEAFRLVEAATKRARDGNLSLRDAALGDEQIRARLSPEQIDHALDPLAYLGSTDQLIDRALAGFETVRRVHASPSQ
ncbi:MAG TPA: 3-carboxy-cis,cis-muconate cycloisomerase [Thermomicrobiales bacterium]|nr:3-carboxy-cis,cis-muconate cycloisomerase [Thermomicrobiales bacterium]